MIDLRRFGVVFRGRPLVAVSEALAGELGCADPERLARRLPAVLARLSGDGEGTVTVVNSDGITPVPVRVEMRRDGAGVVLAGESP